MIDGGRDLPENTKENKTQKSKLDKCNSPHNCQNL
jgi:hypothetical protein